MADKKAKSAAKTKSIPPAKGGTKSVPPKASAKPAASPAPVSAAPAVQPSDARAEHTFRRKITGTVVSAKMTKTVVVEVIRRAMHPMYKKYVRVRNKYKVHDEANAYKVGDKVEIMEHRPISKQKRWTVTRLISRPVEA